MATSLSPLSGDLEAKPSPLGQGGKEVTLHRGQGALSKVRTSETKNVHSSQETQPSIERKKKSTSGAGDLGSPAEAAEGELNNGSYL